MRFIRVNELTKGMRLAKPIYNKNGVMLYDRDTKLTKQGINSIKNFKLIGIYILEPAEPLPPMTEDDIEFERFQTMSVFGLKEDMEALMAGKKPINMMDLIKSLIKRYAKRSNKVNFVQNLRSCDDYVYKHCINVAVLAALMGARLRISVDDMKDMVYAALIHDIGKLYIPQNIVEKTELSDDDKMQIYMSEMKGERQLQEMDFYNANIKQMLQQKYNLQTDESITADDKRFKQCARILQVAEYYDDLTSMKIGKEPCSDIVAIRDLLANTDRFDEEIVAALIDSMKILHPGVCVEFSNGHTGLVVKANEQNVLRPMILCFNDNQLYDFSSDTLIKTLQIRDIMKTMDKRIKIDQGTIEEYLKKYNS
ncbi:MAG: HD domain-containing protein [Lachnospiraceae bacterium]|nr:HD domain-containing protein [Lachnospiraceae bacterium]